MAQVADLDLAATAAMLMAHETAKVVDHDAVMELQNKLDVRKGFSVYMLLSVMAWASKV